MTRSYLILAISYLLAMPSVVEAADFTLDSGSNCAVIGLAVWGGVGMRPTMCWRTSAGVETLVALRSDNSSGAMNQGVKILGGGGNDTIWMVPFNAYNPPTNCDCGVTGWYKMDYNGWWLDIYGEAGADLLEGAVDSGDTWVFGGTGNDICYNYSTVGAVNGNGDHDDLVSDTTGGSDELYGETGNDCLWDTSGTFSACNCGGQTPDYRHQNHTCTSCSATIDCCGIC